MNESQFWWSYKISQSVKPEIIYTLGYEVAYYFKLSLSYLFNKNRYNVLLGLVLILIIYNIWEKLPCHFLQAAFWSSAEDHVCDCVRGGVKGRSFSQNSDCCSRNLRTNAALAISNNVPATHQVRTSFAAFELSASATKLTK